MKAPLCDIDESHGPMMAEHIWTLDGEVNKKYGLYWFCQVKDCDGYGGPVKANIQPLNVVSQADGQMELFNAG